MSEQAVGEDVVGDTGEEHHDRIIELRRAGRPSVLADPPGDGRNQRQPEQEVRLAHMIRPLIRPERCIM